MTEADHGAFHFLMGGAQNYTFQRDSRKQLDAQSAFTGLQLSFAELGVGKASFRYLFQYLRSPQGPNSANDYIYRTAAHVNTFGLDFSKQFGTQIEAGISYRLAASSYVTVYDYGIYDRSGPTHSISGAVSTQTPYPLLHPSLQAGVDLADVNGDAVASDIFHFGISNYSRFGKLPLEVETSISYLKGAYPRYPGGRSDHSYAFGLTLGYRLSAQVGSYLQSSLITSSSTVDYFSQSRWTSTAGLSFSTL
jgi:hypothetical protein